MSDLISRQAVLAIVKDSYLDLGKFEDCRVFCSEIKALPSVEPIDVKEPKNGERFSCPNCGFKADWFIPFDSVKAEIKKNILDEPVENGTNAEMACYNGGLLKCLEIIDKHTGKET